MFEAAPEFSIDDLIAGQLSAIAEPFTDSRRGLICHGGERISVDQACDFGRLRLVLTFEVLPE